MKPLRLRRICLPLVVVVILAVCLGIEARASATVGGFTFGQIDWYDEDGTLQIQDSLWGTIAFDVSSDPVAIYYLNVSATFGSGG